MCVSGGFFVCVAVRFIFTDNSSLFLIVSYLIVFFCEYVCTYLCIFVCVCVCAYAYIYVCVCVCFQLAAFA